jgi:hypothetical protein
VRHSPDMKRIYQLFLVSIAASPFGCSATTDTMVADAAQPVAEVEVLDACKDYCRRVAACDANIDESVCTGTCDSIADQAKSGHCEATLQAALVCIDDHFCQFGYPNTKEVSWETVTPCQEKAAAVDCVFATPPELEPAFGFFGTGFGMSAFRSVGISNTDGDWEAACSTGSRSSGYDGWFEIRCGRIDEHYACSCLIDDRVTATFETEVQVCPMDTDLTDFGTLHRNCDWRY